MAPVNELLVRIDATTEQLRREMRRADQTVAQTSRKTIRQLDIMDRRFAAFGTGLKGVAATFGLAFGAGTLFAAGRGLDDLFQSMEDISDSAKALDLTAEALQELRFAAEQNGLEAAQLDRAWKDFMRRIGQARRETGPAVAALNALNIEIETLGTTEQVFEAVVRQLNRVEDQAQRAALAGELFGDRLGPALVPLLDQGVDGIDRLRRRAQELGNVMEGETVESVAKLNREWRVFSQTVSLEVQRAILGVVSQLVEWRDAIADVRREWDEADLTRLMSTEDVEVLRGRVAEIRAAMADILTGPDGKPIGLAATVMMRELEAALAATQARIAMLSAPDVAPAGAAPGLPPLDVTAAGIAAREAETDKVGEFIAKLREQNSLLRLEADERAKVEAVMRAQSLAVAEGTLLSEEQVAQIRDLVEAQRDLTAAQSDAEAASRDSAQAARNLGLVFTSAFEEAVIAGSDLRDVVQGLTEDLAKVALRRFVTEPLLGGFVELLGQKAVGGQVAANQAVQVGETGREIFVPGVPGNIIPAGRASAMGRQDGPGGGDTVFIDATGADAAAVQRLEAAFLDWQQGASNRTLAIVQNAALAGGSFGASFR